MLFEEHSERVNSMAQFLGWSRQSEQDFAGSEITDDEEERVLVVDGERWLEEVDGPDGTWGVPAQDIECDFVWSITVSGNFGCSPMMEGP